MTVVVDAEGLGITRMAPVEALKHGFKLIHRDYPGQHDVSSPAQIRRAVAVICSLLFGLARMAPVEVLKQGIKLIHRDYPGQHDVSCLVTTSKGSVLVDVKSAIENQYVFVLDVRAVTFRMEGPGRDGSAESAVIVL